MTYGNILGTPTRGISIVDISEEDRAWQLEAACINEDPDIFFPLKGQSAGEAKLICYDCPVKSECLEHALRYNENLGVWGGRTARERQLLRKGRSS